MVATQTKYVKTPAFQLAMSVLDLPVGPTYKELQKQARVYLNGLKSEDYEELKKEALAERTSFNEDDYVEKLGLFQKMLFTPRECQAYAGMRLDSPGVRRVIARRALLGALRCWAKLPKDMILPDVACMEDSFLKDDKGMSYSDERVMDILTQIRRIVRC